MRINILDKFESIFLFRIPSDQKSDKYHNARKQLSKTYNKLSHYVQNRLSIFDILQLEFWRTLK